MDYLVNRDVLYKTESSFHNEFSVNSQLLLLINFLIVTGLVMYVLTARSKRKQGGPLDVSRKADSPQEPLAPNQTSHPAPEVTPKQPKEAAKFDLKPESETPPVKKIEAILESKKEIVYFVYNGHEWEAHEVLGLESGVSLPEATQHYQNLIKTSDPSTFEFYDAAFAAILKLKRNKW